MACAYFGSKKCKIYIADGGRNRQEKQYEELFMGGFKVVSFMEAEGEGGEECKRMEVPKKFITENFKPSVVSLNHKVSFFATTRDIRISKDTGAKSVCGLSPVCGISWGRQERIGLVMVCSEGHPSAGKQVICCEHHAVASCKGFQLDDRFRTEREKADLSSR